MLTVGQEFPPFRLTAVKGGAEGLDGPGQSFTEIAAFGRLHDEFVARNAVVYGVSTDSEFAHLNWRLHNDDLRDLPFAMLADLRRELSTALGVLDRREGGALRAAFILDPDGTIQWASANGLNVGRNPQEVLRVLEALQTGVLCPCGWEPGGAPLDPQATFEAARGAGGVPTAVAAGRADR